MSLPTIQDLRSRRERIWSETRSILQRAADANRDLTPAELADYEERTATLDALRQRIDHLTDSELERRETSRNLSDMLGHPERRAHEDKGTMDAFRSMLLENNPKPVTVRSDSPRIQYQPGIEARDLATTGPANFQPVSFYDQIIESMVNGSSVLAAGATVLTTQTGESLRIPRATAMSSATLTAEADALTESDPTLGVVTLGAFKYGILIQASREVIEDSGADLQNYLARETGTALGLAIGNAFINGAGTTEPRGVLADSTAGVTAPAGVLTSLGAQATAGQGTDLLNSLFASVAEPYTRSRSAGFLMRGATLAAVRNLKASTGELVGSSWLASAPAPVFADAYVPAMAADAKSVLFGDWSRYFVRIVNGIRFERSDDYAFNTDQITYRAIIRTDGALVDPSAIKHLLHPSA